MIKMNILVKLKQKIFTKSDIYNYYKVESEMFSRDLKKELDGLKRDFNNYKKHNEDVLESYNALFNYLLVILSEA